jgi:hypothetical protein
MEVSPRIAPGIYFFDPDGNRNQLHWATGLKAKQAYLACVDLGAPLEILAALRAKVEEHGTTGYIEPEREGVKK